MKKTGVLVISGSAAGVVWVVIKTPETVAKKL